jgi:hypothetical protein
MVFPAKLVAVNLHEILTGSHIPAYFLLAYITGKFEAMEPSKPEA